MTRDTHIMISTATPANGPEATGALVDEATIRELFAARAELAFPGATASLPCLEWALECLEAVQQASWRMLAQAA